MKLKKILALAFAGITITANALAMDWNQYDDSKDYAASSMHQGYYTVDYIPSVSIDLYNPPFYALSVNQYSVKPDHSVQSIGRATYLLNYDTKEVQLLDLAHPEHPWIQLPMAENFQQIKNINKLFRQAYGIDFQPVGFQSRN